MVRGNGLKTGTIVTEVNGLDITVNKAQTIGNGETINFFDYETLSFDESVLGWTSFFNYEPEQAFSLGSSYYSVNER